MSRSQEVAPKKLACDGTDSWHQGPNLVDFLISAGNHPSELEGLTGTIKLDSKGLRSNFSLSIIGK